jgi:hypothetical protein
MSSSTNQPAGSSTLGMLQTLAGANGYIALAISAAGVLIPLGKALISKIESIGKGNVTITFTDLVAADDAELAAIVQTSGADLVAINAELAKLGLPAIAAPASGS